MSIRRGRRYSGSLIPKSKYQNIHNGFPTDFGEMTNGGSVSYCQRVKPRDSLCLGAILAVIRSPYCPLENGGGGYLGNHRDSHLCDEGHDATKANFHSELHEHRLRERI